MPNEDYESRIAELEAAIEQKDKQIEQLTKTSIDLFHKLGDKTIVEKMLSNVSTVPEDFYGIGFDDPEPREKKRLSYDEIGRIIKAMPD